MRTHSKKNFKGFTLIEVLVVIALIAVLAAITIIAINPQRNFEDARNTQRSSDVTQILNAVTQYSSRPGNQLSSLSLPDCTAGAEPVGTGVGNVDLSSLTPDFIVSIPVDPNGTDATNTGYEICTTGGGRVRVSAPLAENTTIEVER